MAFVEFERAGGSRALVNPDHVVEVTELTDTATSVHLDLIGGRWLEVQGTWDEVIEKLGQATDVYIEEREEPEEHVPFEYGPAELRADHGIEVQL